MTFTPTTAQLELLAELEMARMPVAVIADRLGVDVAAFKAWTARLDAVRNFEEPPPSNAKIMRKPLVEREHWLRRSPDKSGMRRRWRYTRNRWHSGRFLRTGAANFSASGLKRQEMRI
jgi:hypothetical protein